MKKGFTLIELLVVIAIISVLSSVVLASLNGAREKSYVSSIVSNLKQSEKALILLADDENISLWWTETNFGFGGNPDLSKMVTDKNRLGKYLNTAPGFPVGTNIGYDNDNDIFVCGDGGTVYRGVNIHIRNVPKNITEKVSEIIDGDNNVLCGRVKWDPSVNGSLFYSISESYLIY